MLREISLWYWVIINGVAAAVTWWDKRKAQTGGWRVPEATLFGLALAGGSVGMYATMRTIRHKTRHRRFMWGLPAIILLQMALVGWGISLI